MNAATKVVARASILNFAVALLMMYWAWRLFPSMATRLFGYILFVIALLPVSSISALAIRWGSARWQHRTFLIMLIGMVAGALACYLEAALLHLGFPKTFGVPTSADALPGFILGALIGFGGIAHSGASSAN